MENDFKRPRYGIDTDPGTQSFKVRYGEYWTRLICDDPWRLAPSEQLTLAFRAAGAGEIHPEAIGRENLTGLMEDEVNWYECEFAVSSETVLALKSTRMTWSPAAEQLAEPFSPPPGMVETVHVLMREFAQQQYAKFEARSEAMRKEILGDSAD